MIQVNESEWFDTDTFRKVECKPRNKLKPWYCMQGGIKEVEFGRFHISNLSEQYVWDMKVFMNLPDKDVSHVVNIYASILGVQAHFCSVIDGDREKNLYASTILFNSHLPNYDDLFVTWYVGQFKTIAGMPKRQARVIYAHKVLPGMCWCFIFGNLLLIFDDDFYVDAVAVLDDVSSYVRGLTVNVAEFIWSKNPLIIKMMFLKESIR